MALGDGDPGVGPVAEETGIRAQVYNGNTEIGQRHKGMRHSGSRTLLAQQWKQNQALAQALERQRVLDSDGAYSSNTENAPSVVQ